VEPIIDDKTAQRVSKRKEKYKRYSTGKAKHNVLTAGLIHCAERGSKMSIVTITALSTQKDVTKEKRVYYSCPFYSRAMTSDNCTRWISVE
jgi:hypothetical protein